MKVHIQNAHEWIVRSVAITSDSRYVVSGSEDRTVKIFDIESGNLVHNFQNIHQGYVRSIAVSRDCKYIVSGSEDRSIRIFDLVGERSLRTIPNAHRVKFHS